MPKEVQRNGVTDPVYDALAIRAHHHGWTLELHATKDTRGRHALRLLRVKSSNGKFVRGARITNNDLAAATRELWHALPNE